MEVEKLSHHPWASWALTCAPSCNIRRPMFAIPVITSSLQVCGLKCATLCNGVSRWFGVTTFTSALFSIRNLAAYSSPAEQIQKWMFELCSSGGKKSYFYQFTLFYLRDGINTLNLNLIRTRKRNLGQGYIFRIVCYSVHRRHEESARGEERNAYSGVCILRVCLRGPPSPKQAVTSSWNSFFFYITLHNSMIFFQCWNPCLILQISQSTVNSVHWSKVVSQAAHHITVTKLQVSGGSWTYLVW